MMDIISLHSDLDTFYKSNVRKYNFINPRYIQTFNTLSWQNYISKEHFDTYPEYYDWVLNKVQYSFMLSDESILQIFFEGERKGKKFIAVKGSMAYLPRPDKYSEYFRFDLDYKKVNHYLHTAYHVHFGYRSQDVRFCLYQLPIPSEFVKFILSLEYGADFSNFNHKNFFCTLDSIENKYNHILQFVNNK